VPETDAPHLCALCGQVAKGYAWGADGKRLCHTSDPETSCYTQVTQGRVARPLAPSSDRPEFLVHAHVLSGTGRLCGATGGRMTVRREAVECPVCFYALQPDESARLMANPEFLESLEQMRRGETRPARTVLEEMADAAEPE
jgi:hypothetical protein